MDEYKTIFCSYGTTAVQVKGLGQQMKKLFLLIINTISAGSLFAQRPPALSSPDVHADRSVTFRYYSRTAQQVFLHGEFLKAPIAMIKDTSGVWTVTIPPVEPDIYPYSFRADSTQFADPNNEQIFPNERFKRSVVDIPGEQPLLHVLQNVPHGKISYRYYQSATLGVTRTLLVYTPPGFNANAARLYPVLYLIHGGSDIPETWTKVGRANFIADNLIAAGKAKPMIIVLPYGNVRPRPMSDFTNDVMNDIIPFIESNYPVVRETNGRAVAGFSVGGGQTLNIGLATHGKFGYVCSYAPYTATEEFQKNFVDGFPDTAALVKQLKLFTISVGTEDFLYESVKRNIKLFQEYNIPAKTYIVTGGHTWMNCRKFLATTLQEIFQ